MEQLRPASADAGDAELGKRRIERREHTRATNLSHAVASRWRRLDVMVGDNVSVYTGFHR